MALITQACGIGSLGATPTPTQVPTRTRTPTPAATFTASPSPTWTAWPTYPPTLAPVFTDTPEPLTGAITSKCDRAFGAAVQEGPLELPLLALKNTTYENKGWLNHPWFPHLQTIYPAEARTLVCIRVSRAYRFSYTDGKNGYKLTEEVRVVQLSTARSSSAKPIRGASRRMSRKPLTMLTAASPSARWSSGSTPTPIPPR